MFLIGFFSSLALPPLHKEEGSGNTQYPSLFWRNAINLSQQVWQQLEVLQIHRGLLQTGQLPPLVEVFNEE